LIELKEINAEEAGIDVEYSDDRGRQRAAPGMAQHAVGSRNAEETQERELFARRVAETAQDLWRRGSYDRLVLAAPPKMLGLLRERLDSELMSNLVVDLGKDLLKVPVPDLPRHFEDHIVF
jgi:protein required for attachment to host cells